MNIPELTADDFNIPELTADDFTMPPRREFAVRTRYVFAGKGEPMPLTHEQASRRLDDRDGGVYMRVPTLTYAEAVERLHELRSIAENRPEFIHHEQPLLVAILEAMVAEIERLGAR